MRPFLRSRLAIFSSELKIAVGLIIRARADIVKPEQTGVLSAAKSNTASTGTPFASTKLEMIPVDGQLVVTDDSVRFPASPNRLLYNIPTHQTRLLPSKSREVDRLYDQLESSSAENPQAQRWPSLMTDSNGYDQADCALAIA
jgi:hypothetical protein